MPHVATYPRSGRCNEFFPDGAESTLTSGTHSRIVSEAHTKRIKSYIDETRGKVVFGGQAIIEKKWIAPTIIRDVDADDSTMQEYVFGYFISTLGDSRLRTARYLMKRDLWSGVADRTRPGRR